MGWSIGYDVRWKRDIGYGVPASCDHPDCTNEIDRGISYICGGEPFGGDRGCGLYFCSEHLKWHTRLPQLCERCYPRIKKPFTPKADSIEWLEHKLQDYSWKQWRIEHPEEVMSILIRLGRDRLKTEWKDFK